MKIIEKYLFFFILALPLLLNSQQVSNIHFEQVGKQIHIYYDLEGDQEFIVQVFCSENSGNNWGSPLISVTGAIDENQKSGTNKLIIWDVLEEREKLEGEISFKIEIIIAGTFTDTRDDQAYKWVRIGEQTWMAENLNFKTKSGSRAYDNNLKKAATYGRLYDWNTACKICPRGWHLPSIDEWSKLINYLGGEIVAGRKMSSFSKTYWNKNLKINSSGFSALPGGWSRDLSRNYVVLVDEWAVFWSFTESSDSTAWVSYIDDWDKVFSNDFMKYMGLSVCCVKD